MSSPITKTLGSRSISWPIASDIACAIVSRRAFAVMSGLLSKKIRWPSGEHVLQRFRGLGVGTRLRVLVCLGHFSLHALDERLIGCILEQAQIAQVRTQTGDRIVLTEVLDLALRPVGLGVAFEVAEISIGLHLDQRWSVALPRAGHGRRHRG